MSGYQILHTVTVDVTDRYAVATADWNTAVDILIIDSMLAPRDEFTSDSSRLSRCLCDSQRFVGKYRRSHKSSGE